MVSGNGGPPCTRTGRILTVPKHRGSSHLFASRNLGHLPRTEVGPGILDRPPESVQQSLDGGATSQTVEEWHCQQHVQLDKILPLQPQGKSLCRQNSQEENSTKARCSTGRSPIPYIIPAVHQ